MRDAVRLLTPAVLFACGDGGVSAIEYPPNDVAFEWLRGEELVSTEAPSTLAYALAADPRSNRLVLLDFYADEPLVILEPDGTIVSRLGGRGDGPGEFQDVRSVTVADGYAYVWDSALHRLSWASVAEPTEVESLPIVPPTGTLVREVEPLSSGEFLCIGKMGDRLGMLIRDPMEEGEPLGQGPGSLDDMSGDGRRYISLASAVVDEERDLLAVAYQDLGEMVFARLSTGETLSTTKPGSWPEPDFTRRRGSLAWTHSRDNFVGYRSVEKSEHGVWGFFAGNTWKRSHGPYGSRDVHVFGWDGELKRILRLSQRIDGFAILGDYLYGAVNDPVPAVVRWRIPDHLLSELIESTTQTL